MAAVVLGVSSAASGWAASTALVIGGIGTPTMHDVVMSQLLGGALSDVERVSVDWPAEARPYTGADDLTLGASIDVGITNLSAQIDAALARLSRDEDGNVINGERVTVVGLSAGSLVVTEVLRLAAADPEAPDEREINFVVVADSSRQEIIDDTERYNPVYDYTYRPAPETVYDTIVVTGEYDGFADFPDRWWNLTAVANAMAGSILVHVPTMFADLTEVPEENVTVEVNSQGGSTTHYLIPAERLPLVQLFPSLAPREAELKASIDKAYTRNDPVPSWLRSTAVDVQDAVEDTVETPTEETVPSETETVVSDEETTESDSSEVESVADSDEADVSSAKDEDDAASKRESSAATEADADADRADSDADRADSDADRADSDSDPADSDSDPADSDSDRADADRADSDSDSDSDRAGDRDRAAKRDKSDRGTKRGSDSRADKSTSSESGSADSTDSSD